MNTIIFTGGGTAGHVTPFFAVAPYLKNAKILFIGSENGIEESMVKGKYDYMSIPATKFYRGLKPKNLLIPFRLAKSVREAKKILEKSGAKVVFSKGGYVALPVALAAFSLKIPVVSHESDFSPGITTKITAKKTKVVFTTFPSAASKIKNGVCVGAPIREEVLKKIPDGENKLLKMLRKTKQKSENKSLNPKKPVLLVFGGGSGSKKINDIIRQNSTMLLRYFDILHICGKGNIFEKAEGYLPLEFVTDMAEAYSMSSIVLARCGSNSAWEITARGLPALYIPLKKATRGDQIENAEFFKSKKTCLVLDEDEADGKTLLSKLLEALRKEKELSLNAEKTFSPCAGKKIADYLNTFFE